MGSIGMVYSGVESLRQLTQGEQSVVRSFDANHERQIGVGFMFKHGAGSEFDDYLFPYYSICYVIQGLGNYYDHNGQSYELKPGSVFQRLPDRRHSSSININEDWIECYLDFDRASYDFFVATGVINPNRPCIQGSCSPHIEAALFELMQELKLCPQSQLPDLLLRGAKLLRDMQQPPKIQIDKSQGFLQQSCEYFSSHYDQRIDIKDYCQRHGKGYEWFRKAFKQSVGVSPRQYIVRRRMEVACQYLRYTRHSINQIALMLGYSSASDFSAQFKSTLGQSPQNYRQSLILQSNTI
ncbi:transcriptional regulator AraC family [Vibrio variabilis]|uniref:Transcriptional regulator AraC family n=1 Tax=Vibrio variabilis TaxID=990271 RepID=A0ABQ0JEU4_9VIBR|nr:transcriptional regulator AraC family [Vibrio variabilis]